MTTAHILIVGTPLIRAGLVQLLSDTAEISIVGEASDFAEFRAQLVHTQPNIVLVSLSTDLAFSEDQLLELIKVARKIANVLILTPEPENVQTPARIAAGATAYLPRNLTQFELVKAILDSLHYGLVITEEAAPLVREHLMQAVSSQPLGDLSKREREVLQTLGNGLTNQQIADSLSISVTTVRTHIQNISRKLEARNRSQLVMFAAQSGLNSNKLVNSDDEDFIA
jgi:DNA-binding NarL/FixJ family response regulator